MDFQITEYKPNSNLASYVEFFWEGKFNINLKTELAQNVVPNGFVELIIHSSERHCELKKEQDWSSSPDYTIIGLYTRPYLVKFRDLVNVFGIRFKPEGIYNLFGIPASVFSESYEDMEQVLGVGFREYCSRIRETATTQKRLKLTNEYLLKQLEKHHPELNYVNRAAEMLRQSDSITKIDELPGKVYISLRQLEREFKDKVGTTPKRYMRISRVNEAYRKMEEGKPVSFTKLALDCGYSDQAHFIRDFKSFTGVNPTSFTNERHNFIVNPPSA